VQKETDESSPVEQSHQVRKGKQGNPTSRETRVGIQAYRKALLGIGSEARGGRVASACGANLGKGIGGVSQTSGDFARGGSRRLKFSSSKEDYAGLENARRAGWIVRQAEVAGRLVSTKKGRKISKNFLRILPGNRSHVQGSKTGIHERPFTRARDDPDYY